MCVCVHVACACGMWHVHVVHACMSRSKIGMCSPPPPPCEPAAAMEGCLACPSVATGWCVAWCSPSAPSEPSSTREEEDSSEPPLIGCGECGKASTSRRGARTSLKAGTLSERPALGPSTGLRARALRPRAAACTTEAVRARVRVGVRFGLGLGQGFGFGFGFGLAPARLRQRSRALPRVTPRPSTAPSLATSHPAPVVIHRLAPSRAPLEEAVAERASAASAASAARRPRSPSAWLGSGSGSGLGVQSRFRGGLGSAFSSQGSG